MTDPLDQIARICAEAPEDALSRIADVLGFKEQQAEPSDPTGLIARLRIHAEDRANTAFARSSMREAAGVLEDQQGEHK